MKNCFRVTITALIAIIALNFAVLASTGSEVMGKYDSESATILRLAEERGHGNADYYTEGMTSMMLINATVHENVHLIGSTVHEQNNVIRHSYYSGAGTFTDVTYVDPFDSSEIADIVPQDCRGARFQFYVVTDGCSASDTLGIYGLAEEFTAYMNSSRNAVCMLEYCIETGATPSELMDAVNLCENGKAAWSELVLFMSAYLKYAEENYPDTYASILTNQAFWEHLRSVNRAYMQTLVTYENHLQDVAEALESKGYWVEYNDDEICYIKDGLGHRKMRYSDEYKPAMDAVNSSFRPYYEMICCQ